MKLKLLIADDDATTRRILNRAVALLGHDVVAVNDGRELLDRFAEVKPDLILTDWRMPEMDGVEAIERIRAQPGGRDVFIVLSTGVYGASETANAIEAGADDYILKPISVPALRVLLMLSAERIARRRMVSDSARAASDTALPVIVEHFPGMMVATDLHGRVCGVNRVGAVDWRLVEGATVSDLFSEVDRPRLQEAFTVASTGKSDTFVHIGRHDRPHQTSVWPLVRDGQVAGFGVSSVELAESDGVLTRLNAG